MEKLVIRNQINQSWIGVFYGSRKRTEKEKIEYGVIYSNSESAKMYCM